MAHYLAKTHAVGMFARGASGQAAGTIHRPTSPEPPIRKYPLRLRALIWITAGGIPWLILHLLFRLLS